MYLFENEVNKIAWLDFELTSIQHFSHYAQYKFEKKIIYKYDDFKKEN